MAVSSAGAIRRRVNSVGRRVRDMLQRAYHHHIFYHTRISGYPMQDIQEHDIQTTILDQRKTNRITLKLPTVGKSTSSPS